MAGSAARYEVFTSSARDLAALGRQHRMTGRKYI